MSARPACDDAARAPSNNTYRASTLGVLASLLAFRIVNALTLRTFFQPDEFFQALEPAWQLAFGQDSNAWITWEWRTQLRSSLHPAIFAAVYRATATVADLCGLRLYDRAELLIAAPKVAQAVCAALLDYYSWRLAEKVYGRGSRTALATLALSVCSPWQWFCSTRTLSNCLETTVASTAVYYWPWHWPGPTASDRKSRDEAKHAALSQDMLGGTLPRLRLSLLLAAFACILRPTNILVWLSIALPSLWQASIRQRYILVREILLCGSAVLACSVLSDRLYYQLWTLPPLRFLYFNIAQSLAVFYGKNRADYYLTEGLPLLLTTALPFAVVGSCQALSWNPVHNAGSSCAAEDVVAPRILSRLAWASLIVTFTLSLISHKEVRFLYPVLPFLHVLSARPLSSFSASPALSHKVILTTFLAINVLIAGYTSQVHQRGVVDVLSYLRYKHEARVVSFNSGPGNGGNAVATTVAFLMPCHSTPWRSHLVYPHIEAWALTCEPPLDVPLSQRSTYLDEADQFYLNPGPVAWLEKNMQSVEAVTVRGSRSGRHWGRLDPTVNVGGKRAWPQNLVFFEQLEPTMEKFLNGTLYRRCWKGFNTHFHDDWRRVGDVVVWCMD
ncbi:Alg9-like mannosyltransferase family-domain-containing protein [Massariosphaeria phaeospora]|uniref:Mannosyltransferase n=1 Tax=Massariosphaeria phaeospora TaxID=100035 RepID=A0A7C8ICB0_9PLEO|nr:Alg9-like mannosyltransferase family-domain-containing protein [Massariosphaeria phaeospora]